MEVNSKNGLFVGRVVNGIRAILNVSKVTEPIVYRHSSYNCSCNGKHIVGKKKFCQKCRYEILDKLLKNSDASKDRRKCQKFTCAFCKLYFAASFSFQFYYCSSCDRFIRILGLTNLVLTAQSIERIKPLIASGFLEKYRERNPNKIDYDRVYDYVGSNNTELAIIIKIIKFDTASLFKKKKIKS